MSRLWTRGSQTVETCHVPYSVPVSPPSENGHLAHMALHVCQFQRIACFPLLSPIMYSVLIGNPAINPVQRTKQNPFSRNFVLVSENTSAMQTPAFSTWEKVRLCETSRSYTSASRRQKARCHPPVM
jgi:hypothetical protein